MRILELVSTLEEGGAELMLSTLAIELRARGHVVHLACLREAGFMPIPRQRFDDAGVQFIAFNKGDGFSVKTLRCLSRYIRDNRIEIVHSHNPQASHYGAVAGRLGGAKAAVTTVHGSATLAMPAWSRALFWASCLLNDRVVAVCRTVGDELRSHFKAPGKRYTVVHNGIQIDSLLAVHPRHDETIVFGTMARLVAVKDHNSLLRAFALVHRTDPRCRLEILGDGELRSSLETLAESLGLRNAVTFHGWHSDIASFLARIDIFVLSSLSEGLPLTILEAMAAGKAIVATSVGGVIDVVQNSGCGWLCPPGTPELLSEAMELALRAPDRVERGARGRSSVIQNHSLPVMTDHYGDLFVELLGGTIAEAHDSHNAVSQSIRQRAK